jgi:DNA-binding transcriptional LysR family regulator
MELRHLRYFVAVAEELHFGRAAARLNMSQPPLSQQIAALERDLGVRLLERTRRQVRLTDAGRLLLDEAKATLDQAARARLVATRAQLGEVGELRIGLFASAPLSAAISDAISAFRRAYPDVTLTLREAPSPEQIDALLRGRLDFGFLRSPNPPQLPGGLTSLEVVREPLCVVLPLEHHLAAESGPVPIGALAGESFVFFSRAIGSTLNDQLQSLCLGVGFVPRITQEATTNSMILGLVAAGLGISVLPAALCWLRPDRIRVRPLDASGAMTASWLNWRQDRIGPLTSRFIEHFRQRGLRVEGPPVSQ